MSGKMKTGKKEERKKAVAIRYEAEKDPAPRVIGKGTGAIAEKIIALAQEHGIPIHEDTDLVEILSRLDLNAQIPPETYVIVAEILAFIYKANDNFEQVKLRTP